ncbi:hypothetical protein NLG97_g1983 [Lecanicillium saksenae]|uniref:Uncharacterized protein n=1 Tax=Lecanicillium saksenae TaxID=468837 RepID=A0ACC1R429_9HYPO|nr:hypothetical protein NLG97_g1983 [Lecanicillium saksenae]
MTGCLGPVAVVRLVDVDDRLAVTRVETEVAGGDWVFPMSVVAVSVLNGVGCFVLICGKLGVLEAIEGTGVTEEMGETEEMSEAEETEETEEMDETVEMKEGREVDKIGEIDKIDEAEETVGAGVEETEEKKEIEGIEMGKSGWVGPSSSVAVLELGANDLLVPSIFEMDVVRSAWLVVELSVVVDVPGGGDLLLLSRVAADETEVAMAGSVCSVPGRSVVAEILVELCKVDSIGEVSKGAEYIGVVCSTRVVSDTVECRDWSDVTTIVGSSLLPIPVFPMEGDASQLEASFVICVVVMDVGSSRSGVVVVSATAEDVALWYWRTMRRPGGMVLCAPKSEFPTAMCARLAKDKNPRTIMARLRW